MPKSAHRKDVGLGIRQPHFLEVIETKPDIPWFEALVDNYLGEGGPTLGQFEKICSHYPITFHCVGMNLGSVDPLDRAYFEKIKVLSQRFNPGWISDHLSWSAVSGRHHHDLLPLPYTEEAIKHVSGRIMKAQDLLGQRILLENASSYIEFRQSEITEWEFLGEVAKRSDCLILLDINNIYVNSINHGFSPAQYLQGVPKERVCQFHLAGYQEDEYVLIDTHGSEVSEEVWNVFEMAIELLGPIPTIIERDNSIPELSELLIEMNRAKGMMNKWT
jgi:uncharacterized protein (UPF0276 family)